MAGDLSGPGLHSQPAGGYLSNVSSFRESAAITRELLLELQQSPAPAPLASRQTISRLLETGRKTPAAEPATPKSDPAPRSPQSDRRTKAEQLESLRPRALACTKCPHLASSRTQVVFGVGNPDANWMFVGEAPGADEDAQGEPFVGRAGQLLTKIIEATGLTRGDVYIANVLKCRPDVPKGSTGNRKPEMNEMATCLPWLIEQIRIISPSVIVALGSTAAEGLLKTDAPMRELRGNWHQFEGIPVMVTYHPAYLLRNQAASEKRKVWEDMLDVMDKLEMPVTQRQRNFFKSAS